jgi:hypothetical protein
MLKWRNSPFAVIITIFLFSACSDKKSDGIRLRLNYPKGFEQVIISEITTSGSSISNIENIIEMNFKLDSVINNETYLFTARVLRMRSKMVTDAGTETYDSEKENSFPAFERLVRSDLTIQINRYGKVVQPFLFAGSQEKAGSVIDMSKIQLIFPDKELKVGDTWKSEGKNELVSGLTRTTYELKEVTDTELKIKVIAKIEDGTGMLGDKQLKGEYILDRKTNRLKAGKLDTELSSGGKFVYKMYEK